MQHNVRRLTTLLALLLPLSSAVAADQPHGTWKDARVTDVTIHTAGGTAAKGYVVVTFAANGAGSPSCASGYPRNPVIDITTEGGKVAFAMMQSAVMLSKLMTVTGTGTCSLIPNTETLASLQTTERDLTMSSGR